MSGFALLSAAKAFTTTGYRPNPTWSRPNQERIILSSDGAAAAVAHLHSDCSGKHQPFWRDSAPPCHAASPADGYDGRVHHLTARECV